MDLSPGQQRLLFVVVVIVLVGLGAFVIEGRSHGNTAAAPTPTPTPTASAATSAASVAATATPPATEPAATPPATTAGGANIYQWLPFTQPDLTAAAKTTLAFAKDYVTWNSKESKAAYGASMASLVTAQEDTTLENDFATAARAAGNAVSTGSAAIDSISSFGSNPASITFSVTITQQVVPAQGTSVSPSQYDVTVVSTGSGWQVNNIQLFNVGNE
ncbi:MAG: hypothetical protein ABSA02_21575 [Trebonia sp.]|jgi:hypothetical protein